MDDVILCTGYAPRALPFLSPEALARLAFAPLDAFCPLLLAKLTWAPGTPGLAFVGMYRGPYFGIMELQAVRC